MKLLMLCGAVTAFMGCSVSAGSFHENHNHLGLHERKALKRSAEADSSTGEASPHAIAAYGEQQLLQPAVELSSIGSAASSSTSSTIGTSSTASIASLPTASSSTQSESPFVSAADLYAAPVTPTTLAVAASPALSPRSVSVRDGSSPSSSSGNPWCMAYSPYTNTGTCKSASDVATDIADIASKGFSCVRLYSTDCSGLQNVGNACKQHNLKLLAGVYISETGISGAQEQVQDLISWGQWDLVEMIVLGNEAIFNEFCSASDLASFITASKQKFKSAGYSGPCTTTEPLNVLQENTNQLCGVIDVVAANLQAFFNAQVTAAGAGDFVASQLKLVGECCPGKTAYNLETGWPNAGDANGAAIPGVQEQQQAIAAIRKTSGANSTFFSYVDDLWKQPGEFNVEQKFGCGSLF